MKSLAVILGLALCIIYVQARHYSDRIENEKRDTDEVTDSVDPGRDYRAGARHRRKRWQMSYGYDYPPPPNPYYSERRDYDRNLELIPQIWRLLDEISAYVRRPVMPQPIYVPYPVPYPVPQNCTCNVQVVGTPNVTKRFPAMEDINQNWGITDTNEEEDVDDDFDGSRPISFDPIKPKTPMLRPQPEVEHGSNQASQQEQSVKQERVPSGGKMASACNAAILMCCSEQKQQKACFTRQGCGMTFSRGNACSPQSIAAAIDAYRSVYT